jgi:N-acetyl-anhydromuramyl-L-alanine amidase AmpD
MATFNDKFGINPNHIPTHTKRRSGMAISKVRFIVAHDTGNPGSTATQNAHYYINSANEESTSAHFFVDDKDIIECIPAISAPVEKAWHVLYNTPKDNELYGFNANDAAIGVEYCYGINIDSDKAYEKYVWILAKLCDTFKLDPAKDIVGHFFLDPHRRTDPLTGLSFSRRTYDQLLKDVLAEYMDCIGNPIPVNLDITPKIGIVTVAVKLNLRTAPNRSASVLQVLEPNTAFDYTAIISNGETVNNNSVWYQNKDGHYIWSGGIK